MEAQYAQNMGQIDVVDEAGVIPNLPEGTSVNQLEMMDGEHQAQSVVVDGELSPINSIFFSSRNGIL